jgi:hypothetical protein
VLNRTQLGCSECAPRWCDSSDPSDSNDDPVRSGGKSVPFPCGKRSVPGSTEPIQCGGDPVPNG